MRHALRSLCILVALRLAPLRSLRASAYLFCQLDGIQSHVAYKVPYPPPPETRVAPRRREFSAGGVSSHRSHGCGGVEPFTGDVRRLVPGGTVCQRSSPFFSSFLSPCESSFANGRSSAFSLVCTLGGTHDWRFLAFRQRAWGGRAVGLYVYPRGFRPTLLCALSTSSHLK